MVERFVLPNGVTCVCEERPNSGFVTMQVGINQGSASEAPEENGLTNLTVASCVGGTATRSREQISAESESKGGGFGCQTGRMSTSFEGLALTGNEEATFAVMADVIRNPSFAPQEVERTKSRIAQVIAATDQEPPARAAKAYIETAFQGEAVGRDSLGTTDLLASFTPEQIRKKHEELLSHPSGIVVSFAGDIDAAKAKALAEKYFGDIPAAAPTLKVTASFAGGDVREAADNDQLNLLMGFPAPGSKSDDRFAAMMLENLLSGGMSTPIFQEFRAKRGLVYTAGAQYFALPGESTFFIASGSGEGKAGEITKVTFDILGKAAREGFDQKTMDEARERILRELDGAREQAAGSGGINAGQILEKGQLSSRAEFEAKLKAVTSDDIRRVCAGMLKSGKYALSAVGPLDTLPEPAEIQQMMKDSADGVEVPEKRAAPALATTFAAASAPPEVREEPKIRMTVLENGLKIVTIERDGPLSCGAWVGDGSDNETPEMNGAKHMIEHMMFRGTPLYPPGSIASIVEGQLAGALNAYTTKDKTCYYFFNLNASALDKIIEICGQMVFFANIAEKEYAGVPGVDKAGKPVIKGAERDAVFEEINMDNDDVGHVIQDLTLATAYPGQPHGRSVLGTQEGLSHITAKQLRDIRDTFYTSNNVVFCAAGPIKHEDFVEAVKAQYGHLKPGSVPELPAPHWVGGTGVAEVNSARLCNVIVAAPSVARTDPEACAYDALAALLGNGASSPLHRELVDRLQYTPVTECGTWDFRNGGTFIMEAMTTPELVKPAMAAMYRVLRDTADNLSEVDLAKAKAIMETGIRVGLETNGAATNAIACDVLAFGRVVPPEEIYAEIRKLTVGDLKKAAEKILAANPAAAMVVPPGTDRAFLPEQKDVIAMRDGVYAQPAAPKPQAPGINPSAP